MLGQSRRALHAEHLFVQTVPAAATDEGALNLAIEGASEAADDAAAKS